MSNHEQEITTPMIETFVCLKEQALQTNLLHVIDVEALEKLSLLNQLQQQSDSLDEFAPEQKALDLLFKRLYNWLEVNKYFVHRDEKTRIWRLGTYLSKKSEVRRR